MPAGQTIKMKKLISKETESDIIKLGLYQIIGGVVGMLTIFWEMYRIGLMSGLSVLVYLLIILFFAYSIFCGILCLKTNENALKYSLANQILQVISFSIMGFAFKYVAGFVLTIGLDLTNSIEFNLGVGISKFKFDFNSLSQRLEVDLNLIAFALIYWIDKLMKKVKEEAEIRQVSSIGQT